MSILLTLFIILSLMLIGDFFFSYFSNKPFWWCLAGTVSLNYILISEFKNSEDKVSFIAASIVFIYPLIFFICVQAL